MSRYARAVLSQVGARAARILQSGAFFICFSSVGTRLVLLAHCQYPTMRMYHESLHVLCCCTVPSLTLAFTPQATHSSKFSRHNSLLAYNKKNNDDELFDSMTRDILGQKKNGFTPATNPFASRLQKARKSLYSDEELMKVLSLHEQFSDNPVEMPQSIDGPDDEFPSLHDMVTTAIGETSALPNDFSSFSSMGGTVGIDLDDDARSRIRKVRAIASDVDGTLLSSRQTLHPRTRMAVKRALQLSKQNDDFFFFPATGKTRKGALDSLGIEIGTLIATENVPGVYIQGLYCVDGEGNVLFERKLAAKATAAAERLAKESGISIVAYDGDNLYTTEITEIIRHLHEHYGEPMSTLLPGSEERVRELHTHEPLMHKLLLMDDDVDFLTNTVRPQLEKLAEEFDATVTQAIPTMLEWLPKGCSKAMGVAKVCEALEISMENELLALGDAENDAEMLQQASIGVAMGNGCPAAKKAADYVLEDTNDDGGAGTAMEVFAFAGC